MPFKNIKVYIAYKDRIQMMAFNGYSVEFFYLPFGKVKRTEFGKGSDWLYKIKEHDGKIFFTHTSRIVLQSVFAFSAEKVSTMNNLNL